MSKFTLKCLVLLAVLYLGINKTNAQFALVNGYHHLEISGNLSAFGNIRFLKAGETDHKKNRFNLRDAQVNLEYRYKKLWEAKVQFDIADILGAPNDPENPGLMDAWVKYRGLRIVDITFGYGVVPYSRSSLTGFMQSPYWQRPEIARGSVFSRRDVGLNLQSTLLNQLINIYAGAYTGLGEISLKGDNDASGKLEFVGRVDFSYPSRYRFRDIDYRNVPKPMISVGVNGRYANKALPVGEFFPTGAVSDFNLKVYSGKRLVYGMDAAFQWKGFSAIVEIHQLKITPKDSTATELQGFSQAKTKGYFLAGGWYGQVGYFCKPIQSAFSVRYEMFDQNDLVNGNSTRISAAYAYKIKHSQTMIKLQYWHNLEDELGWENKWTDQVRLGMQFAF